MKRPDVTKDLNFDGMRGMGSTSTLTLTGWVVLTAASDCRRFLLKMNDGMLVTVGVEGDVGAVGARERVGTPSGRKRGTGDGGGCEIKVF